MTRNKESFDRTLGMHGTVLLAVMRIEEYFRCV